MEGASGQVQDARMEDPERRKLFDQALDDQDRMGQMIGARSLFSAKRGLHPRFWGMSRAQMKEFRKALQKMVDAGVFKGQPDDSQPFYYPTSKVKDPKVGPNMHEVNRVLIKEETKKIADLPGLSWAVWKNVATAGLLVKLFFSHAWDEGVFEFLDNALAAWEALEAEHPELKGEDVGREAQ